ncbi:hypothetical protein [Corynebacterium xerosis]|uniref:hypothetical protein n=1 Tax=Corynebacterium xerosis TaxID=1725 RepID=UPI00366F9C69
MYCSPACRAAASRERAAARHVAELNAARAEMRTAHLSVEDQFIRAAHDFIEELRDAPIDRLRSQKVHDAAAAARIITDWYEPPASGTPVPAISRQQRRALDRQHKAAQGKKNMR